MTKSASTGLINLLLTGNFVWCDLYTITLVGGGIIRLTNADIDITIGSNVWSSGGPYIDTPEKKAQAHWKVGLDVDSWIVEITPRTVDVLTGTTSPDNIGSTSWLAACHAGALDGAEVNIDRAYFPNWPSIASQTYAPAQVLTSVFAGRVSQVEIGRSSVVVTINSHLELLTLLMPRNLFQTNCVWTLFDSGCTLNAASYAAGGTITVVSAANIFGSPVGFVGPANSGTYTLGRVVFTSGKNNGYSRTVRQWNSATSPPTFTLMAPPPFTMNTGDLFTAYPGCDKTMAACVKFNNLAQFGGTPFIPTPETAT